MYGQSLQEMIARARHNAASAPFRQFFGIVMSTILSAGVFAKATVVTLPELVSQSNVIAYGQINGGADDGPRLEATAVLKGAQLIHGESVILCNTRPTSEWPDLAKSRGDHVLFLKQHGSCFNLSHNYRSHITVHNGMADTIVIQGQPDNQSLEDFLGKVRAIVANQAHANPSAKHTSQPQ